MSIYANLLLLREQLATVAQHTWPPCECARIGQLCYSESAPVLPDGCGVPSSGVPPESGTNGVQTKDANSFFNPAGMQQQNVTGRNLRACTTIALLTVPSEEEDKH